MALKRYYYQKVVGFINFAKVQEAEYVPVWDYSYDGLTRQVAEKPVVFYKEPTIAGLYISAPLECEEKMCNIL